jgi:hypothetical protein
MIKRECHQYLADIPDRKTIDVAQEFSEPVAKLITRQWFDLSEYAINTILALSHEAAFGEHENTRSAAKNLIVERLNSLIDERQYNPGPDLISQLAAAWSKFKLDDRWLVAFVGPMFHSLRYRDRWTINHSHSTAPQESASTPGRGSRWWMGDGAACRARDCTY